MKAIGPVASEVPFNSDSVTSFGGFRMMKSWPSRTLRKLFLVRHLKLVRRYDKGGRKERERQMKHFNKQFPNWGGGVKDVPLFPRRHIKSHHAKQN